MWRRLLALTLVFSILHVYELSPALMARSLPEIIQQQAEQAEGGSHLEVNKKPSYLAADKPNAALAKQAVEGLRVGTHVMVKVLEGTIFRGHIQAIDEKHFTLRSDVGSQLIPILYDRVLQVEENVHVQVVLGVIVAIGIAVASLIIVLTRGPRAQPGPNNPIPSISSLSPSSYSAPAARRTTGGAIVLTLTGSGFIDGSVVRWNGSDSPTTFISSTELQAEIPLEDIERVGAVQVTVFNPGPGGGNSDIATFTISQ